MTHLLTPTWPLGSQRPTVDTNTEALFALLQAIGRAHQVDPTGLYPNGWWRDGRTEPEPWEDPWHVAQFATAIAFLSRCERTKRPTRKGYSYALKHAAERWGRATGRAPYVSNGSLIAAAYALGFTVERDDRHGCGINAEINVTAASLRQLASEAAGVDW